MLAGFLRSLEPEITVHGTGCSFALADGALVRGDVAPLASFGVGWHLPGHVGFGGRLFVEVLGMQRRGHFEDHGGFDGVIVGRPAQPIRASGGQRRSVPPQTRRVFSSMRAIWSAFSCSAHSRAFPDRKKTFGLK